MASAATTPWVVIELKESGHVKQLTAEEEREKIRRQRETLGSGKQSIEELILSFRLGDNRADLLGREKVGVR